MLRAEEEISRWSVKAEFVFWDWSENSFPAEWSVRETACSWASEA